MPVSPEDIHPAPTPGAPAGDSIEREATTVDDKGPTLPPEVLKIPAFHALLQGSPPATYADAQSKDPAVQTIAKNFDSLKEAGFGLFQSQSKPGNAVLYNGLILPTEKIQAADQANQLDSVAVPFEQLMADYKGDGEGQSQAATAPPASPDANMAPTPQPGAPAAPAGVQKAIANKRTANLVTGAPSSGPSPGGGRVLNALQKPTI